MNEQQRNGLVPSFLIKINVHSPKKKEREKNLNVEFFLFQSSSVRFWKHIKICVVNGIT